MKQQKVDTTTKKKEKKEIILPQIKGLQKKDTRRRISFNQMRNKLKRDHELSKIYLHSCNSRANTKTLVDQISETRSSGEISTYSVSQPINRKYTNIQKTYKKKITNILEVLNTEVKQKRLELQKDQISLRQLDIYNVALEQYQKYCERKKTKESILDFITILRSFNQFFKKIDDLVSLSFLKIGKIQIIEPNQYLFHEGDICKGLYLILWGQFKLKKKYSKKSQYCISGECLGQEIINDVQEEAKQLSFLSLQTIDIAKGVRKNQESAKSLSKSGVLFLLLSEYRKIKKILLKFGEKEKFYQAQNMIKWMQMKKKRMRQ